MALTRCAECSREISDKAKACPQCGFPVAEHHPQSLECLGCHKTVPFDDQVCPHCGLFNSQKYKYLQEEERVEAKPSSTAPPNAVPVKKKTSIVTWAVVILVGLWFLGFLANQGKTPTEGARTGTSNTARVVADSSPAPDKKYTASQIESASTVMENVRQLANVYEDGPMLVVEFNDYLYPHDVNKRLQFVRAVADADAVLQGKARSIYFYEPGNKKFAKADTYNGVRLED